MRDALANLPMVRKCCPRTYGGLRLLLNRTFRMRITYLTSQMARYIDEFTFQLNEGYDQKNRPILFYGPRISAWD